MLFFLSFSEYIFFNCISQIMSKVVWKFWFSFRKVKIKIFEMINKHGFIFWDDETKSVLIIKKANESLSSKLIESLVNYKCSIRGMMLTTLKQTANVN